MANQNLTFTATSAWQSLGVSNKHVHIRNSSTSQAVYVCVQSAIPDDLNEGRELNTYSEERDEFDVPLGEDVWIRVKNGTSSVSVYVELSAVAVSAGGDGGGDGGVEVTQGEHFATANNLLNESVGAFILRARPASVVANICNVFITNKGVSAVTITEDTRTQVLRVDDTMILGTGVRKINNLNTITLGAVNSFRIMWSELDA